MNVLPYQIVALDVDGTLLHDDHHLSDRTKRTVQLVHEAGAKVVLCTGRSLPNSLAILQNLELSGTIITNNGAVTIDSSTRHVDQIYDYSLEAIMPYLSYCRCRNELNIDLSTPTQLFVERMSPIAAQMYELYSLTPDWIDDFSQLSPLVKMSIYGEKAAIDDLQHMWSPNPGSLSLIRSGDHFIDVMHPEATKGNALQHFATRMGVPRERILAIGNYYNDQAMIEFAGMGIAVANAPDDLKQIADCVTLSNNEDGVHFALVEHFFRGNRL